MLILLVLQAIRFLVPHHTLALLALVLILFNCGLAADATVPSSASAGVVCNVSGEISHRGCLGLYRLSHFLYGGLHLSKLDVDPAAAALAAAPQDGTRHRYIGGGN